MKKRTVRVSIDILMTVLMPVLMAYSLVGETLHEIAGSLMFVLFITHHAMNRRSTLPMFKGRQTPARVLNTAVNILLFVFMLAQPVSGIVMSKHLYTFLPTDNLSYGARSLHLPLGYWGFVLSSLHLGLHFRNLFPGLGKNRSLNSILIVLLSVVSVYGIYAFVKNGFGDYMFLTSHFAFYDFDAPRILFFIDYLSVMILFATLGFLSVWLLKRVKIEK